MSAAGGEYKVTVRLILDQESLERMKKAIGEAFGEGLKNIAKVVQKERREAAKERVTRARRDETGGFLGGLAGLGRIGGAAVTVFALIEIAKTILHVVQAIFNMLREASPLLNSTVRLIKRMWDMVLRPIGDLIAIFIRPFLLILLRFFVVPFYRYVYPTIVKLAALLTPEKLKQIFPKAFEALERVLNFLAENAAKIIEAIAMVNLALLIAFFTALEILARVILGVGPAIMDLLKSLPEAGGSLLELLKTVGKWIWDNILKPAGELIFKFLESFKDDIAGWLKEAGDKLWNFFFGAGGVFGDLGERVQNWLKDNVLTPIGGFVDGLVSGIKGKVDEWTKQVEDLWGKVKGFYEKNISPALDDLSKRLGEFGGQIKSFIDTVVTPKINEGIETIKNFLKTNVGDKLEEVFGLIKQKIREFFEVDWGKALWEGFGHLFKGIADFFGRLIPGFGVTTGGLLGGLFGGRQFGGPIERAGFYRLEAGEFVLSKHDVLGLLSKSEPATFSMTVNVTVTGPVYGVEDLERVIERKVNEVGRKLYEMYVRGAR